MSPGVLLLNREIERQQQRSGPEFKQGPMTALLVRKQKPLLHTLSSVPKEQGPVNQVHNISVT